MYVTIEPFNQTIWLPKPSWQKMRNVYTFCVREIDWLTSKHEKIKWKIEIEVFPAPHKGPEPTRSTTLQLFDAERMSVMIITKKLGTNIKWTEGDKTETRNRDLYDFRVADRFVMCMKGKVSLPGST